MKKYFAVIGMLFFFVVAIFAQDEVPVIPDWTNLYDNFPGLMGTYLGMAGIVTFLGEALVRLFKMTVKWQKITVIIVLGVGLAFLGNVINVGFLAESPWYETLIWGATAGAVAAGVRSGNVLFIKQVVDFIIGLLLPKEPVE